MTTERKPLTDRQHQVLSVICAYIDEHGFAPTHRELRAALGLASPRGIREHLYFIARKGYIKVEPNTARGIRVLVRPQPKET